MIPRLRGRSAQIQEPIEDLDKWVYEVSLWDLSGENQIGEPGLFGPYETEAIALEEGRKIIQKISEKIEKELSGEISGMYLDLKNGGVMRPWKQHS